MGLSALAFLLVGACTLVPSDEVRLETAHVRVADVVSLDCIPETQHAEIGAVQIASLPDGRHRVRVTRQGLATLLRRRVPRVTYVAGVDERIITLRRSAGPVASSAPCYALAVDIAERKILTRADLTEVECTQSPGPSALHTDGPISLTRARTDLPAGLYLGHIALPQADVHDAGTPTLVRIVRGPVSIERHVVTLQPGIEGDRVFVRDDAGVVFVTPLTPAEAP